MPDQRARGRDLAQGVGQPGRVAVDAVEGVAGRVAREGDQGSALEAALLQGPDPPAAAGAVDEDRARGRYGAASRASATACSGVSAR